MKSKFLSFFLFFGIQIFSQDLIITLKNENINAKIIEVTTTEIKYKIWDHQDGPLFNILKSTVCMIKYSNGSINILNRGTIAMQKRIKEEQEIELLAKAERDKKEIEAIKAAETLKQITRQKEILDSVKIETEIMARRSQKHQDSTYFSKIIEQKEKDHFLDLQEKDREHALIIQSIHEKQADEIRINNSENVVRTEKKNLKEANATLAIERNRMNKILEFQPGRLDSEREQQIYNQQKIIDTRLDYIDKVKKNISKIENQLGYEVQ